MWGTAGGWLFACPLPRLLLQPLLYQRAPVLLAIFGSQAQKYAGDINNSFFEFGQEDRALAPASGAVLGGLGRGQAGADGHPWAAGCREHPAALASKCRGDSPNAVNYPPFQGRRKEDQRSGGSPEAGRVFKTNNCKEHRGSAAEGDPMGTKLQTAPALKSQAGFLG